MKQWVLIVIFDRAFAKAHIAGGNAMPSGGTAFFSVKDRDKKHITSLAKTLIDLGFSIIATGGTATFLKEEGIDVDRINKVLEGRPHIVDAMKDGTVDLVINTTEGAQALADSFSIRRTALLRKIPYTTTIAGARALINAIKRVNEEDSGLEVKSLQAYL